MKRVNSDESGRALALTLIILGIGTLLLPVFLAHASTNLFASQVTEEDLKEQYAAAAGIEYAISRMSTGEYTLDESFDTPSLVNSLPVSVTITEAAEDVYRIVSEAEDTRIESYVCTSYSNLLWLLENAITSAGDVTIQSNSVITGDVRYAGEPKGNGHDDIEDGTSEQDLSIEDKWPSASELSDFYWVDVEGLDPYPDQIIDVASGTVADPYLIGPLYYVGYGPDLLQIESTTKDAMAVLTGTIYVEGDLDIGQTNQDFTLDLNGQTIYVEGVLDVGGKAIIAGSGCLIAEGDVFFLPKTVVASPDDFVLVMSVNGESQINPGGSFYGSLAGDVNVDLQPGITFGWTTPFGRGLNFPTGSKGFMEFVTYRIYRGPQPK